MPVPVVEGVESVCFEPPGFVFVVSVSVLGDVSSA